MKAWTTKFQHENDNSSYHVRNIPTGRAGFVVCAENREAN